MSANPIAGADMAAITAAVAAVASKPRTPALALTVEQACDALSVSWDTWKQHIAPNVRIVRVGRRKLISVTELQRWLDTNGESVREAV